MSSLRPRPRRGLPTKSGGARCSSRRPRASHRLPFRVPPLLYLVSPQRWRTESASRGRGPCGTRKTTGLCRSRWIPPQGCSTCPPPSVCGSSRRCATSRRSLPVVRLQRRMIVWWRTGIDFFSSPWMRQRPMYRQLAGPPRERRRPTVSSSAAKPRHSQTLGIADPWRERTPWLVQPRRSWMLALPAVSAQLAQVVPCTPARGLPVAAPVEARSSPRCAGSPMQVLARSTLEARCPHPRGHPRRESVGLSGAPAACQGADPPAAGKYIPRTTTARQGSAATGTGAAGARRRAAAPASIPGSQRSRS